MEKFKCLYTAGRKVKSFSCYGKVWQFHRNLNTELSNEHSYVCTPKELKTGPQTLVDKCFSITVHDNPKVEAGDFCGGTVVKNPPASAGDTGSIPGPGRYHMLRSN